MTRKEEIRNAKDAFYDNMLKGGDYYGPRDCFEEGAEWADANPKSPWISVEDDLPCNHEDMIFETNPLEKDTVIVLVRFSYGGVSLEYMHCRGYKQEWAWSEDDITHWMPIPNVPKS